MDSIKYIGLDVHQSTISVAVLDADGKLVMQSVIATHATTILDFLHGLRGTLHVTFEEGTHSAWLYDLLVRRVAKLVVCNPRKNALLKAGNKSDTVDARKLAELLRAGLLSPVYHGQNSTAAVKHMGPQLCCADGRHHPRHGPVESALPQPGHCLCRQEAVWSTASRRMVSEVKRERVAAPRRAIVPATGPRARVAPRGPPRSDPGVPQAQRDQVVAHHSVAGSDSRRPADRASTKPASLPQQAAVLGLLWPGAGDAQQRRLWFHQRATGTEEEAGVHPWIKPQPQPRSKEPV